MIFTTAWPGLKSADTRVTIGIIFISSIFALMFIPSPTDSILFFDMPLFLKRDDALPEPFSGNKGRKFSTLLTGEFPGVSTLIGYGSPQSNSLYSMAALARQRGWTLEFYVDHLADSLFKGPSGNYGGALALGAQVLQVPISGMSPRDYIETVRLVQADANTCLYVPEGGRCSHAREGVHGLGREILDFAMEKNLPTLKVFLPSGTGTTALFLSEYFYLARTSGPDPVPDIRVITCPVVGDDIYLKAQFAELVDDEALYPEIRGERHHYAKLHWKELQIWAQMRLQGVEFELLYDPCGLLVLKSLMQAESGPWLYIHQGGLRGNVSMLPRYRRKYPHFFTEDSFSQDFLART